jgi:hypothetical protein
MLNYGAAAQSFFNYKTNALMNADLTADQKAMVAAYDASYFTGAVKADPNKVGAFAASGGYKTASISVSFEGAFGVNYYFLPSNEVSGNVTMYVWTADTYANAPVLTSGNSMEIVTASKTADGAYVATIKGIAAKSMDDTIYAAAVYTDANGQNCCSGVIAYSLSTYCMKQAGHATMGELAKATAMYGYYAAEYFAN